jgi:hypothetical protein
MADKLGRLGQIQTLGSDPKVWRRRCPGLPRYGTAGIPPPQEDVITALARPYFQTVISWILRAVAQLGESIAVERAAAALAQARQPRIHLVIATSEIHLKHKLKKTQQQVLDEAVAAVELARRHADDVEFSAEDAARTEPDFWRRCRRRSWRQERGR